MLAICGIAVTAALASAALRKYTPEISAVTALAGAVIIFLTVLMQIAPLITEMQNLTQQSGIGSEYGIILLKTCGICAISRFTSDCCKDNGQQALASRVELAARVTIIIIALPLFKNILAAAVSLIPVNQMM